MDRQKPQADQILAEAIKKAVQNRRGWTLKLLLPALLIVITNFLALLVGEGSIVWVLLLVQLGFYAIFAVATHRLYLLDAESIPERFLLKWTNRETYFTACAIGLIIVTVLIVIPFAFIPPFGPIIGIGIASYIMARCSLVFPAAAINHGLTYKDSWRLTKNHQLLMIVIALGIPFMFAAPMYVLQYAPYAEWVGTIVNLVLGVFAIGCLSLTYKQVTQYEAHG